MVNVIYQRNCVDQVAYHVIWCIRYRRNILNKQTVQALKLLIAVTTEFYLWFLPEQSHIHYISFDFKRS